MNNNLSPQPWLLFILFVLALLVWIIYPGGSSYYKSLESQLAVSETKVEKALSPESKPVQKSQPGKQPPVRQPGQPTKTTAQPAKTTAQPEQTRAKEPEQPKAQVERVPSWQRAQNQQEETLWEQAVRDNTAQAYLGYLNAYPKGRYAKNAQEALKKALPAAPRNLTGHRAHQGQSLQFWAKGRSSGTVWGGADGVYTDDSILEKAAVHAGKLKVGEEGIISVTIMPGQSRYRGNTQNGISTQNYASWQGSFRFN